MPKKSRAVQDRVMGPASGPAPIWSATAGEPPSCNRRPIPPRVRVHVRIPGTLSIAPKALNGCIPDRWRPAEEGGPESQKANNASFPEPSAPEARVWLRSSYYKASPAEVVTAADLLPARVSDMYRGEAPGRNEPVPVQPARAALLPFERPAAIESELKPAPLEACGSRILEWPVPASAGADALPAGPTLALGAWRPPAEAIRPQRPWSSIGIWADALDAAASHARLQSDRPQSGIDATSLPPGAPPARSPWLAFAVAGAAAPRDVAPAPRAHRPAAFGFDGQPRPPVVPEPGLSNLALARPEPRDAEKRGRHIWTRSTNSYTRPAGAPAVSNGRVPVAPGPAYLPRLPVAPRAGRPARQQTRSTLKKNAAPAD